MLGSKRYEYILFQNNTYKEIIIGALDVVKEFLIEKKRLLTGGMTLDYSLKLKGDRLYDDSTLPDYDFFSPEFHKDAYDLAKKLEEKGFKEIAVINALHVSTMKVRVYFTSVADITYIPQSIYDKIPRLVYGKIHLVHPHYQVLQQHHALSLGYKDPPLETINFRWKKVMTRHDMIWEHYPLDPKLSDIGDKPLTTTKIKLKNTDSNCLYGYSALAAWVKYAKNNGFEYSENLYDMDDKTIKLPSGCRLCMLTNDYAKIDKYDVEYRPFLDILPAMKVADGVEYYDNRNQLIAADKIDGGFWVTNPQCVLTYLMAQYLGIYRPELKNAAYYAIKLMRRIIIWAAKQYPKDSVLCLLPTPNYYGDSNEGLNYQVYKHKIMAVLGKEVRDSNLQPKRVYMEDGVIKIPQKYYDYDPTTSRIYEFDGQEKSP